MKKIYSILISLASLSLVFTACDKIEGPYLISNSTIETDVVFPPFDTAKVYQKILIEEFTGHLCPNCPDGNQEIRNISTRYGDTVISLCAHTGMFSWPEDGLFSYDFQCTEASTLATDFGVSMYPTAVIERTAYNGKLALSSKADWAPAVANINTHDAVAAIQIINQYNPTTRSLKTHTRTTALKNYDEPVKLALYIVEDGIVAPQQVNTTIDTFYVHNHILRTSINGVYGSALNMEDGGNNGLTESHAYQMSYQFDCKGKDWGPDNCSVIAILFNSNTKEILQVEKAGFSNE